MSEPAGNDATRPTVPGARSEPANANPDLSGQERTVITDLSGAMTQVGPPPSPHTAMTVMPGGDVQDAIPTHLSDAARKHVGTGVTNLHVGAIEPSASEGTHLGETWGDFQFIRLLGRGGMGAVYLGKQISLDRQVAIKVLPSHLSENEQFRDRFQLEAKAVAKMSSPHVVQVFAAGMHQGHHYFAMEYVDGEDLSRKLRAGFKPSYRQALELVIQGAKGLCAAGEHGIVHRDIKPGNMMIDRKGSLKIMDFGLVRLASAGHSLTMSGTVMGTVSYFSPEQGRGEPCDQRTDLYALGVVFYELLTGRLPFTGENATSVIYQHIHAPPKAPRELDPNIPVDYQAVVLKCMQKQADDRYLSAVDLLSDLERLAAQQPPAIALERPDLLQTGATIIGSGSFAPPRPAPRGRGGLVAALALAACAAAAVGWYATRPAPAVATASPPPAQPVPAAQQSAPQSGADPQIAAMLTEMAQKQDQDKARRDAIAGAEAMLLDGDFAGAEKVLTELAAKNPDDKQVAAAVRKVQVARDESERRALAARAAPTTDTALISARAALARGDLPEARRVVNVNRGMKSDDPAWSSVAKDLDTAEGRMALREAQDAFKRGNTEFAGTVAIKAQALIPDDPELQELLTAIERVEGQRKQRERILQEADNLITENQAAKAEEMLAALAEQAPEDAQVANALRRARAAHEKAVALERAVREQLAQGTAALDRADLDAAQLAFTAARQLDPKNESATLGLNTVRERKDAIEASRKRIETAINDEKDLIKAEAELAALERIAPGSPQAILAASQVNAAKLAQTEARVRAEAAERLRQERAKAVAAALDDLSKPLPELSAAVDAFATEAGTDRPELPDLRRRLDDRYSRAAASDLLAALAAAITAHKADDVRAIFEDAGSADRMVRFMSMPGARLSGRLTDFTRTGDTAVAAVVLTHAMDNAPEEDLAMRWELHRAAGIWRVTNTQAKPAAAEGP
jgi:predicted Ser/Thr protein kinase